MPVRDGSWSTGPRIDTYEIERARVAFDLARKRRNKLTSIEKRSVMKSGVLWNEVVTLGPWSMPRSQPCRHRPAHGGHQVGGNDGGKYVANGRSDP